MSNNINNNNTRKDKLPECVLVARVEDTTKELHQEHGLSQEVLSDWCPFLGGVGYRLIPPDFRTNQACFNEALQTCAEGGGWFERAASFFLEEMQEAGLEPDGVSYSAFRPTVIWREISSDLPGKVFKKTRRKLQ